MTPVSDSAIPNPGSLEAGRRGCTCPVIDNHHGQGVPTSEGPAFWFTMGCPLHCPPVQKKRPPTTSAPTDLVERLREAAEVERKPASKAWPSHLCAEAADAISAYEALLKEAGEDKARLDWLEQVNLRSNDRNGTVYGWRYDINHNRAALTDCNLPALTIREALDIARFPEREAEIRAASAKEGARLKAFDERFPGVREQARRHLTKLKEARNG